MPARVVHGRFAVCALVLVGASVATRGLAQGIVLEVALLLALGSVVHARRTLRPAYGRPWTWLCVGLLTLLGYSLAWFAWLRGTTPAPPALAVLPVLTFGSFVVASTCVLLRGDGHGQAGLVDSGIVAVAVALALWAGLVGPGLATAPYAVQLASLAGVVALGLVTGCLAAVAQRADAQATSVRYLLVAAGATTAGFAARVVTTTENQVDGQWWITPLWVVAFCATAAATWHPAVVAIGERPRRPPPGFTPSTLRALGAALAVGPIVATAQSLTGRRVDGLTLGVGMLTLVLLVLLRIGMLAQAREDVQARLAGIARRDELTGLANRRGLDERLSLALDRLAVGESPGVTVIFCDLDGFKAVNDAHGHQAGDAVLAVVGQRLATTVRADDVVARFGGDEFVVVAEGDPNGVAGETGRRIAAALSRPVDVGGVCHHVTAATGTAVALPGDDVTADALIAAADAAMYRDKRAQRRTGLDAVPHPALPPGVSVTRPL